MEGGINKDDLRQFGLQLINEIRLIVAQEKTLRDDDADPEWLKSGRVKKLLGMSPNTIQKLRIEGKVRYKKILGTYYYNKTDIDKFFKEDRADGKY